MVSEKTCRKRCFWAFLFLANNMGFCVFRKKIGQETPISHQITQKDLTSQENALFNALLSS